MAGSGSTAAGGTTRAGPGRREGGPGSRLPTRPDAPGGPGSASRPPRRTRPAHRSVGAPGEAGAPLAEAAGAGASLGRGRRRVDSPRRCGGRGVRWCRGGGSRSRAAGCGRTPWWLVGAEPAAADGGSVPPRVSRRSIRSRRWSRAPVESSAPGSSIRAHDQLEQQPGRGGAAHLDQAVVHDVGAAGQRGRAEPRGLRGHPLELVGRAVDQALGDRVRHLLQDDQVAQPFEQVGGEPARVVPGLGDPVDRWRTRRRRRRRPARRTSRRSARRR